MGGVARPGKDQRRHDHAVQLLNGEVKSRSRDPRRPDLIQIVAFPQEGILRQPGTDRLTPLR